MSNNFAGETASRFLALIPLICGRERSAARNRFIFFMLFTLSGVAEAAKEYPRVSYIKGKVTAEGRDSQRRLLKQKEILNDKVNIFVESESVVCLELSKNAKLVLGPSTRVNIPFIDIETGRVTDLSLEQGRLRFHNESELDLNFSSLLFQQRLTGGDFVISFDPVVARASLEVLAGTASFAGLSNEESMQLASGESAVFQGNSIDGEIQYDVLLKGKKIARGQLLPKETITDKLRDNLEISFPLTEKAMRAKIAPKKGAKASVAMSTETEAGAAKKAKRRTKDGGSISVAGTVKSRRDPILICRKPDGRFNQCAWVCEGNPRRAKKCLVARPNVKCVRLRCAADGEWSDRFEYSTESSSCGPIPRVADCDY